jgi:aspartyl-tRNA(Asn)/glutamyl-tRNA(Gln) amidotransferase subunit C
MATALSEDEVRRIAALARLDLTDTEVQRFATQLTAIVGYAAAIDEADTSRLPPAQAPAAQGGRDDRIAPGLDRAEALSGAPDATPAAGLFRVPKVL